MASNGEPGGIRRLTARWTLTAQLHLETAAQIGSRESDVSDATFARTEDDKPILPGATLAGALRNALCDLLAGFRVPEDQKNRASATAIVGSLFGFQERDGRDPNGDPRYKGHESPLIFFDSIGNAPAERSIRDGVRIDPKTGRAQDKLKYDRELSLPGVDFPFRCDLLIVDRDESDKTSGETGANTLPTEADLIAHFVGALKALTDKSVRFGARKSRGLGQVKATCFRAHRYDLTDEKDWLAYADSAWTLTPLEAKECHTSPEAAIAAAWPESMEAVGTLQTAIFDRRKTFTMQFNIRVDGTLLIRSPGRKAGDADVVTLTEKGNAIISGTSLAGAFRAQANRILNTLGVSGATVFDDWVRLESLFGSEPSAASGGGARRKKLVGSRVRFDETVITGARTYRQSRIKVDRFTGGTIDTALFDEQPAVEGAATFHVTVRNPDKADIALLLLAARDLLDGLLTIGGEASVGRGRLAGTVETKWTQSGDTLLTANLAEDGTITASNQGELDLCLEALINGEQTRS